MRKFLIAIFVRIMQKVVAQFLDQTMQQLHWIIASLRVTMLLVILGELCVSNPEMSLLSRIQYSRVIRITIRIIVVKAVLFQ